MFFAVKARGQSVEALLLAALASEVANGASARPIRTDLRVLYPLRAHLPAHSPTRDMIAFREAPIWAGRATRANSSSQNTPGPVDCPSGRSTRDHLPHVSTAESTSSDLSAEKKADLRSILPIFVGAQRIAELAAEAMPWRDRQLSLASPNVEPVMSQPVGQMPETRSRKPSSPAI